MAWLSMRVTNANSEDLDKDFYGFWAISDTDIIWPPMTAVANDFKRAITGATEAMEALAGTMTASDLLEEMASLAKIYDAQPVEIEINIPKKIIPEKLVKAKRKEQAKAWGIRK